MLPRSKCLPVEARRQVIRDNILHCNYEQLAEKCTCTKMTIVRTVNDWREEGGFEELLFNEFMEVYPIVKGENPDKALDKIVYLLGKGITHRTELKAELKTETTERKVIDIDPDVRTLLESAARSYIKTGYKTESSSIH